MKPTTDYVFTLQQLESEEPVTPEDFRDQFAFKYSTKSEIIVTDPKQ